MEPTKPLRKGERRPEKITSSAVALPSEGFQREPLTGEEVKNLAKLVEELTDLSITSSSMLEQRRLLFAVGDELKAKRPNNEQAREILGRMAGFQLELAGRKIVVDRFLKRGSFGAVFKVHEEGPKPWKEMVLKVSLPFDRTDMFVESGATAKDVVRAEQYRNLIMEVAALDALTKEQVGVHPDTGKPKYQRMTRQGAIPPVPILYGAQFIPDPLTSEEDIGHNSPKRRIAAILMEEIDGPSLEFINQKWDVGRDAPHLVHLAKQLATGLKYIHERGVFHSDIKLTDIKINPNDDPIFMDLGSASVAKIAERHAGSKNARVNYGRSDTIFAAPDYVTGEEGASAERDIYAFGVVLVKLIYGQNFKRLADRQKVFETLPEISKKVSQLVGQMTDRNVKQRPTIDRILDTLRQVEKEFSEKS